MTPGIVQDQRQTLAIGAHQMMGLRLLAKSLPELRAAIIAEISRNPAIEDVDHPLETPLSEEERRRAELDAAAFAGDYDDYDRGRGADEEAAEHRQAFFDNQVKEETLQNHLLAQMPLSDIAESDWPLVEVLVGDLDDKGYYKGNVGDVAAAFGRSESEVCAVLAHVMELDPPGCGARDARECLLAQLDSIEDASMREIVRRMVDSHLDDMAHGRFATVCRSLGISRAEYVAALKALRTLDGRPGRQFPSERERIEYVNPEIRAVKRDGRWIAELDERSLPEMRFSRKFIGMLEDPSASAETKAYVRERIAAARALRDAVEKRQDTIRAIAQTVFDRQQEFFEKGFHALKPLTEIEVAAHVGCHGTTVSRTVRDKYASTPQGTVELRRFFATGVRTSSGEELSQEAALAALKGIVHAEDKSAPLSDERIAEKMKAAGYTVARRTVAKYRDKLSIPSAAVRRAK